jgi:radical SAM superfamily enzyme YgiQ (UPF0313 family)
MKEFAFINVPIFELWNPSAALAALTPMIKRNGYQPRLVDINLELYEVLSDQDWDELQDWSAFVRDHISSDLEQKFLSVVDQHLKNINCDWLAISVFSYYSARPTALILNHLKQYNRQYKILLGGSGCMSSLSDYGQQPFGLWALEQKLTDHCIFGEGEQALDNLLANRLPAPGVDNTKFEQIKNLDDWPLPEYKDLDFSRYKDSRVLITGSRGCVRHCTFCDIDLTWPKYAYRSPHLIVEEIRRHVHELGVTKFEFTDSLINGSVKNFNKFNELLIEAKAKDPALKDVSYMGQFICRNRSDMHSSSYELMHYAGCKQIHVGIEHFSERVRHHMKKKFSDADVDYHLEMSSRWHIPNILLMIIGYPTETLHDHQQQLRAVQKYQIYAQTGAIFMIRWGLTMHIYENTPITKMNKELQISFTDNAFHDSVFNWVAGINPGMDLRERLRRRIELHELSQQLGYSMPHSRKELASLWQLAQNLPENSNTHRIIPIEASKN